jgi:hypothetical protein
MYVTGCGSTREPMAMPGALPALRRVNRVAHVVPAAMPGGAEALATHHGTQSCREDTE